MKITHALAVFGFVVGIPIGILVFAALSALH